MAEIRTPPVAAQRVDNLFSGEKIPGSFKFYDSRENSPEGFNFRCPCGCDAVGGVKVAPGGWQWNGDRENPTVQPSVFLHTKDGPHWHGWLKDGVWTSC